MRKLIASVNVTLDGFMAGPNCELDWHFNFWNDEMAEAMARQLSRADAILLGRITYRGMARHFASTPAGALSAREDMDFVDMLNYYPKFVFSRSLVDVSWENSILISGDTAKEVRHLKRQPGKDMIIYGSAQLVSSLTKQGLIDEFRIWVHPIILGSGKTLFRKLQQPVNLSLYKTETFSSGVVILFYHT